MEKAEPAKSRVSDTGGLPDKEERRGRGESVESKAWITQVRRFGSVQHDLVFKY